jgi:hypothetical protein
LGADVAFAAARYAASRARGAGANLSGFGEARVKGQGEEQTCTLGPEDFRLYRKPDAHAVALASDPAAH